MIVVACFETHDCRGHVSLGLAITHRPREVWSRTGYGVKGFECSAAGKIHIERVEVRSGSKEPVVRRLKPVVERRRYFRKGCAEVRLNYSEWLNIRVQKVIPIAPGVLWSDDENSVKITPPIES